MEPQQPMGAELSLSIPDALVDAVAERVAARLIPHVDAASKPTSWLDVEGAARYLACEPHRIYDLVSTGRLRPAKDGRRSLFRPAWLDAYLEEEGE